MSEHASGNVDPYENIARLVERRAMQGRDGQEAFRHLGVDAPVQYMNTLVGTWKGSAEELNLSWFPDGDPYEIGQKGSVSLKTLAITGVKRVFLIRKISDGWDIEAHWHMVKPPAERIAPQLGTLEDIDKAFANLELSEAVHAEARQTARDLEMATPEPDELTNLAVRLNDYRSLY